MTQISATIPADAARLLEQAARNEADLRHHLAALISIPNELLVSDDWQRLQSGQPGFDYQYLPAMS